jgi:hypothetical protein
VGKLTGKWTVRRVVVSVAIVVLVVVVIGVYLNLSGRAPHEGVILDVSVDGYNKLQPYEVVVKGSDGDLYTWNVSAAEAAGYSLGMTIPLVENWHYAMGSEEYYLEKNGLGR